MRYALALSLMSLALLAQAQTSNDNPKLKAALKRFPQADANGDGVLTLEEAKAFKEKADKLEPKDDRGSDIQNSYIYKTVGTKELRLFVDVPQGVLRRAWLVEEIAE